MVAGRTALALLCAAALCDGLRVRVHTPPLRPRTTALPIIMATEEITKRTWCANVDGANNLAVVFFFATWCRTCKAVRPVFERIAEAYPDADFFRVNFKQESELCYNERVFSFPVVHFYLPGVGRVARLVLKKGDAETKLRETLARYLEGGEGEAPAKLPLLKALRTEALGPVVRYKELLSVLEGLADVTDLSRRAAQPNSRMAGLREQIDKDDARLGQLESLFGWLDRDGNGRLSFDELEAAVAALRPDGAPAPRGSDVLASLLERLREQSRAAPEVEVDLATFVRLMSTKAVSDYTSPEKELLPAFEAIDLDGDGTISQAEMLSVIDNFCLSLPDADGCDIELREALPLAISAFADDEQRLDYERFVEMISGRGLEPVECEVDDGGFSEYSSIFGDV